MIIGIDPGITGAVSVLTDTGEFVAVHDMPIMKLGKAKKNQVNPAALSALIKDTGATSAIVEKVGAMPGQGVSSMFNFGMGFGVIQGVLAGLDIPYALSTPQKWKKACGLIGKEKDAARVLAIELFPDASLTRKKDGGRADALLIAKFG
jgi:crossover junction endodeoxyribonuclease RuvC